ncbi:MAG: preprotein translocase subunit SecG [Flavobacteriaceae bacterium]|nr:preprotein translocase subunit SecG [Flavobacteriaceae bacterium]
MSTFHIFITLIIFVSFLLIIAVMVQNPKGGGLSSTFGGGSQMIGGVKKTGDFLDKSTWTLATILIVLILLSNISLPGTGNAESKLNADPAETTLPAEEVPAEETPTSDNTEGATE